MKRAPQKPWAYMARNARQRASRATSSKTSDTDRLARGSTSAQAEIEHAAAHPSVAAGGRNSLILILGIAAISLPLLRLFGVVRWAWVLILAPFTLIGALTTIGVSVFLYRDKLAAFGNRIVGRQTPVSGSTPPPDRLEAPAAAADAGEPILAEHPEILAALCHGFRMKKLMATVLGHPVNDVWGVYRAALEASPTRLDQLRILAHTHTALLARSRRKEAGGISDATAMRLALDAFRPCAEKAMAGRGHPDCPFEHVTVIFGADSPNRDANLQSVAPKVRALLERQYPQLQTARLADGSQTKFTDWQQRATRERTELARLRKENERHVRTIDELRAQVADAEAGVDALRAAAEQQRRQARDDARADQLREVEDLHAAIDRAGRDHAREIQRRDAEMAKLSAAHEALQSDRDALELALLAAAAPVDDDPAPASDLTGVRVLLVGGEPRQVAPLRERLESLGAQLVHDDSVAAAEHVPRVDVVVFWIRYLSHPTYFGVRPKVIALKTPHAYWSRTSPASLAALVSRTLERNGVRGASSTPSP